MMTKKGSTKILNFLTPGTGVLVLGREHMTYLVKIMYFFRIISFSIHRSYKLYIVMMTMERYIKILKFMILRTGVLVLKHDNISHIFS